MGMGHPRKSYRVLAADIDGTLICLGQRHLSAQTTKSLKELQSRGVVVILATGRADFASTSDVLGTAFIPDRRICSNGALILDASSLPVYEERMSVRDVDIIAGYADRYSLPCVFAFEDAYYVYNDFTTYRDYYSAHAGDVPFLRNGCERTRHKQSLPFGAHLINVPRERKDDFTKLYPHLKLMGSASGYCDISPRDVSKRYGVQRIISTLGIGFDEVVSVGDSDNDAELLSASGVGAVMGDALEYLKEAADYVTGTVQEDGVVDVINRFFG